MQCHDLAHPNARRARAIASIELKVGRPRWEPSRDEMLMMRKLSRSNLGLMEAYKKMQPPCCIDTFRKKALDLGIRYARRGTVGVGFVRRYETAT